MIFLDSWVFVEYFAQDGRSEGAHDALAKIEEEGAYISTLTLLEVKCVLQKKLGLQQAGRLISIVKSFPDLVIVPVTEEIAEAAAELKNKYAKGSRFSYGDAVMLATAKLTGCTRLYTGDADFVQVGEIDVTVV